MRRLKSRWFAADAVTPGMAEGRHRGLRWAPERAVLFSLLATVVVLGGWVVPAGAAQGGRITRSVKVLDASGHPFSAGNAGVTACPLDKVPCAPSSTDLIGAPADANGNVAITVTANVRYRFLGYLMCGTSNTTSNPFDRMGAQLEGGTVFTVNAACGTYGFDVFVHYLDGTQGPLPAGDGGVLACSNGSCVVGAPDATGHATVALDPAVSYTISGMAVNMPGWSCPSFVNGANKFWFSTSVSGTPNTVNGATFVVNEPNCYQFDAFIHYLDGTVGPLPSNQGGGILACRTDNSGCVVGSVDASGHAQMSNLDPTTEYTINAFVVNMPGWACGYTGLPPDVYWFSNELVTGTPNLADGMTFNIYQPDPSTCAG